MLYSTSKRFLEVFGLESIKKLPSLRELEDLAREQGVELPGMINQDVSDDTPEEEAEGQEAAAEEDLSGEEEASGSTDSVELQPLADSSDKETDSLSRDTSD